MLYIFFFVIQTCTPLFEESKLVLHNTDELQWNNELYVDTTI